MSKGRNAAKAFQATRSARFAESRRQSEEQRRAEVAAGTRRTMFMVDVEDVRDDDEVAVEGEGFVSAAENRDRMVVVNGQTAVMRFVR